MERKIFANIEDLSVSLAEYVSAISEEAIAERGRFVVALSGGSLPKVLAMALAEEPYRSRVQWDKWHVVFADERCVALDSADSNYLEVKKALLDRVSVGHVYPISQEGDSKSKALDYQKKLESIYGTELPSLDLTMLGMGPDGHTCSLFPGHAALQEKVLWVTNVDDSPKPPPSRITLTLPVVNNSRKACFVSTGDAKADVIANIMKENNSKHLPAGMVRLARPDGLVTWFLDTGSASLL